VVDTLWLGNIAKTREEFTKIVKIMQLSKILNNPNTLLKAKWRYLPHKYRGRIMCSFGQKLLPTIVEICAN